MDEVVAGEQAIHPLEEGLVEGRVLKSEVELQGFGVELLFEIGMGEEALGLGAEEEGIAHNSIVEGLNAEGVPGPEEFFFLLVPDDKGKHTPQPLHHFRAPLHIAVEDHLGVAGCLKGVAGGDKLLAQLQKVVGLAIIGDDIAPVGAEHGLVTVAQVDDGQAAVGDAAALIGIVALLVRPPVADGVAHGLKDAFVGDGAGDEAGKTAHRS